MLTSARAGWLFAGFMAIGCAHTAPVAPPPPLPPPAPAPKPRIKMAVLPVDNSDFPSVAQSLNNVLHDVKVNGVDDYFFSKATLEVVQLSIECVEPTSACYGAVGKQLGANRLLLGRIVAVGKRRRDKSVRVTITLFDVDGGEAVNVVDRVYRTPELASQNATELVAEAAGEPPRYFGPETAPARARSAAGADNGTGNGKTNGAGNGKTNGAGNGAGAAKSASSGSAHGAPKNSSGGSANSAGSGAVKGPVKGTMAKGDK